MPAQEINKMMKRERERKRRDKTYHNLKGSAKGMEGVVVVEYVLRGTQENTRRRRRSGDA